MDSTDEALKQGVSCTGFAHGEKMSAKNSRQRARAC
jgi:hypothetical protein